MKKIIKSLAESTLRKTKKITVGIDERIVNYVDVLAELTNTNRSLTVEVLLGLGTAPMIANLKSTWIAFLMKGDLSKEKQKKIKRLLRDLKKIEEGKLEPELFE